MDEAFIPECYVDTNLIETLSPPKKQYNHQKGCGTVSKVMRERYTDRFAVGIIDKDKKEIEYLKEFSEVSHQGNLILYKHKNKHHYFIQVCPAMEMFIMSNAAEIGIRLTDFDLPENINKLRQEAKKTTSKNDKRFRGLFRELLNNDAEDISRLQRWVDYLKESNYQCDLGVLAAL